MTHASLAAIGETHGSQDNTLIGSGGTLAFAMRRLLASASTSRVSQVIESQKHAVARAVRRLGFSKAALGAALLFASTQGCASCGQSTICSFRGTVNSPQNRTMRRNLMKEGLEKFCEQMKNRDAPLRLQKDQPLVGRFYANQCQQVQLENGDLSVRFSGAGYTHTNLTRKVTFTMSAAVQYNQDFLVAEDACDVYGYFRPRQVLSSDFKVNKIEAQLAAYFNQGSSMGDDFGKQLVSGQLREGFTVIQLSNGSIDFGAGIVELGKKPFHPVMATGKDRITYQNDRVEVHQEQRDFVGPIEIKEKGRALYLTAKIDGGVGLDVFLFTRNAGDQALQQYLNEPKARAFPENARWADAIPPQVPDFRRTVPLPPGQYYLVFDNTSSAGATMPVGGPNDDRAALLDYAIQIGDQ
jgi:hypothetical protein